MDDSPIHMDPNDWRATQNAVPSVTAGSDKGLSKRPGLARVNADVAAGRILGAIGVPLSRNHKRAAEWGWWGGPTGNFSGSAGDETTWRSWTGWVTWGVWRSLPWEEFWEWWMKFAVQDATPIDEDPDDLSGLSPAPSAGEDLTPRTILIGVGTDATAPDPITDPPLGWLHDWHLGARAFTNDAIYRSDMPRLILKYPSFTNATYSTSVGNGGTSLGAVVNKALYYQGPVATSGWANGDAILDDLVIRRFDGWSDRVVVRIPEDISSPPSTAPPSVVSWLSAGGYAYCSIYETNSGGSPIGRIFRLNPANGSLLQIGPALSGGGGDSEPTAMAWYLGRLWVLTQGVAGTVRSIRPEIDTAFVSDKTLDAGYVGICIVPYKGELFVGTRYSSGNGTFATVLKRTPLGVWSTSLTATGGTAKDENGFFSMVEFGGNLYASYYNPDSPIISKIYKYDGSSWTTAYTGSGATLVALHLAVDKGVLYAFGGHDGNAPQVLITTDGSSWTSKSSKIPALGSLATGGSVGPLPVLFGLGAD